MPKLINIIIMILGIFLWGASQSVKAIDIVYPKSNPVTINSKSTFLVGNTTPKSSLTINGTSVRVYDNGAFVHVIPLNTGANIFNLKSSLNGQTDNLTFKITRPSASSSGSSSYSGGVYQPFPAGTYKYAAVTKSNMPIRSLPNDNSVRVTHLCKNTILLLEGIQGNFYKVNLGEKTSYWINKRYVTTHFDINERILSSLQSIGFNEDSNFRYMNLTLNIFSAYKIKETENNLELTIYGITDIDKLPQIFKRQRTFKDITVKNCENNNLTILIPSSEKLWGYDCYYEDTGLVFKTRKQPDINPKKPLDGIKIAIDAGHGGNDAGAVGPTRVNEKDINFDIAKKLEKELKKAGAKVVMIRDNDTNVDLYERVTLAKNSDALFCISIHANSLPDSGNPYIKHGTSTFYYYPHAKDFALTLKNQLISDLKTKDDGCKSASFVMTRITAPISTLVEVAYMINPDEYSLLLQEEFRQKTAESIKAGIEKYLLNSTQKCD